MSGHGFAKGQTVRCVRQSVLPEFKVPMGADLVVSVVHPGGGLSFVGITTGGHDPSRFEAIPAEPEWQVGDRVELIPERRHDRVKLNEGLWSPRPVGQIESIGSDGTAWLDIESPIPLSERRYYRVVQPEPDVFAIGDEVESDTRPGQIGRVHHTPTSPRLIDIGPQPSGYYVSWRLPGVEDEWIAGMWHDADELRPADPPTPEPEMVAVMLPRFVVELYAGSKVTPITGAFGALVAGCAAALDRPDGER